MLQCSPAGYLISFGGFLLLNARHSGQPQVLGSGFSLHLPWLNQILHNAVAKTAVTCRARPQHPAPLQTSATGRDEQERGDSRPRKSIIAQGVNRTDQPKLRNLGLVCPALYRVIHGTFPSVQVAQGPAIFRAQNFLHASGTMHQWGQEAFLARLTARVALLGYSCVCRKSLFCFSLMVNQSLPPPPKKKAPPPLVCILNAQN